MSHELLLGQLKEFRNNTMQRLDKIEEKVDRLNSFKWRILGGAAALSTALTLLGQLIK